MQNLIGIAGLAVGLFCFSVCLYCFRFIEGIDQSYANSDRLVDILVQKPADEEKEQEGWTTPFSSVDLAILLRNSSLSKAEAFCTVADSESRAYQIENLDGKLLPFNMNTLEVDTLYNSFFTPQWVTGKWDNIKTLPNTVVLTETTCRRIFGNPEEAIGKTMELLHRLRSSPESDFESGGILYTVRGVIKDIPLNTSASFLHRIDMLVLNDTEGWINADYMRRNAMSNSRTYALLPEGTLARELQEEINNRKLTFVQHQEKGYHIVILPIGANEKSYSQIRYMGMLALAIGVLILIVGLLNFFYFLIASLQSRMREYATRKIMGSSGLFLFWMIWMQMMIILCFSGLFTAVLIESLVPHLYVSLGNRVLTVDTKILYGQFFLYWGLLVFVSTFVCMLLSFQLNYKAHRGRLSLLVNKKHSHYFRNSMLGIQFFIAWIFVACTCGLYLQTHLTQTAIFSTLSNHEKKTIFNLNLDYAFLSYEEKENVIHRIFTFSGVEMVSRTSDDLVKSSIMTYVRDYESEQNPGNWNPVTLYNVDSCFFRLMNVPMLAGKPMGPDEVVFSQSFAAQNGEILGRLFDRYSAVNKVSGIAQDILTTLDTRESEYGSMAMFENIKPQYLRHCYIRAYPGMEQEVRSYIAKEMSAILPENTPLRLSTLEEDIFQKHITEHRMKNMILFLSVVSILITLLGVYSSVMMDANRRQKEVAIRKINGAKVKTIIILFARLYVFLLILSALFAFPIITLIFEEWKQIYTAFFDYGFLFWAFIFLSVAGFTVLTVFFKIVDLARINPAEIIKNE